MSARGTLPGKYLDIAPPTPGEEPAWMIELRDRDLAPYRGHSRYPISPEDAEVERLERESPED